VRNIAYKLLRSMDTCTEHGYDTNTVTENPKKVGYGDTAT